MKHTIVVGLVAEDMKAVLEGNPKAEPGYGSTDKQAVADLVTKNLEIFDIELHIGEDHGSGLQKTGLTLVL